MPKVTVDNPVINNLFEESQWHFKFNNKYAS